MRCIREGVGSAHIYNPITWEAEQEYCCGFKCVPGLVHCCKSYGWMKGIMHGWVIHPPTLSIEIEDVAKNDDSSLLRMCQSQGQWWPM